MKLIVGLGNPGKQYENTRHNIGFMCLDSFAKNNNIIFNEDKYNGIYATTIINNQKVILLKPQSFINLSGSVVRKFIDYYKIDVKDILVISDDLDIEVGKYKLKATGSSGGHNGLKDIEFYLHTQDYKRLKIGISNDKTMDTKDYVLSHIDNENMETYSQLFKITDKILFDFISMDFNDLMSKYNHK